MPHFWSIHLSVGIGAMGALRGIKIEEIALDMIQEGCKLPCRELVVHPAVGTTDQGVAASSPGSIGVSEAAVFAAPEIFDEEVGSSVSRTFAAAARVTWSSLLELESARFCRKSLLVPSDRTQAGLDAFF